MFDNLERALLHAGLRGGNTRRDILQFHPSPELQSLRRARRTLTFDFAPVCHGAAAHLGHRG